LKPNEKPSAATKVLRSSAQTLEETFMVGWSGRRIEEE
jgi:hypothetical protein